jgi:hypothetical protein
MLAPGVPFLVALRPACVAAVTFAGVCAARWMAPSVASADVRERPLEQAITVDAGATCLDATALIEHVETWLESATIDADLTVVVHGSADRPRVVEFQTLRDGHVIASRRFDPGPARCDHLHAALGLAIAMAIKASLVEEIAGISATPPAPVERSPPPVEVNLAPRETARLAPLAAGSWTVGAHALAALAILPDPAFGLDARVERALGPSFSARAGLFALASLGEAFPGTGRFDALLLAPRVDVCAAVDASARLRVRGCMGAALGAIHARGYDLSVPESSWVRWFAVANDLDLTFDLSRTWSLDGGITLFLPVARNSIVVKDQTGRVLEERDLASVGGFFGLGPKFRF